MMESKVNCKVNSMTIGNLIMNPYNAMPAEMICALKIVWGLKAVY